MSMRCPACGSHVVETSRFCDHCGAHLAASAAVTAPPTQDLVQPEHHAADLHRLRALSEAAFTEGRFPVGIVLGERYRILGLLGRGGMGEVYRAHDLKLDQQVALKFLPEAAAFNPSLVDRFRGEVRIARQISHRNVCRVYDLGDINGAAFISMEYVDGEDLASLLRRIGRLPADKALDFARRLCAGLAAAHEKSVLHRDLKPANIMIDGRGQLLIMDFGLAAAADAITGRDIRSGTPAYMAPEQKDGREVTVRSDVYALGLVLAEMFSGNRPSADGTLTSTSKDVEPAIEKVIQRCVNPDPARRFASALDVARALPGGDPLAEAIAAGDTPSPQMVAASDDTGRLSVRAAFVSLVAVAAGLLALAFIGDHVNELRRTPFQWTPVVMAARARDLAAQLGYPDFADSAYRIRARTDLTRWAREAMSPENLQTFVRNPRTSLLTFEYRQSPAALVTLNERSDITPFDPPPILSGMVSIEYDTAGHLWSFHANPPQVIRGEPLPGMDWSPLFAAAGLDRTQWKEAQPRWVPLAAFDEQAAWEGSFPEAPAVPIHIDAAAWRGRPVLFEVHGPWARPVRDSRRPLAPDSILRLILLLAVVSAGTALAVRHYRHGRGDLAGAARLAAFSFVCGTIAWTLRSHHVGDLLTDLVEFIRGGVIGALGTAALFWVLYVALEPLVRRRWPQSLISWTRLLNGEIRDSVVGGHMLVGAAAGIVITVARSHLALPPPSEQNAYFNAVRGPLAAIAMMADGVGGGSTGIALGIFFIFFLARTVLRRAWLGPSIILMLGSLFGWVQNGWMGVALGVAMGSMLLAVLARYGLLALVVCIGVATTLTGTPATTHLTDWYAPTMLTIYIVILAIAAFSFHSALGGRRLLKADLFD